jgi:L-alanine-DL-glutamate epimerase-like enolase superfamily enzyme
VTKAAALVGTGATIAKVSCALYRVPLKEQSSLDVVIAKVTTADGIEGIGFSYGKRAGGLALFAHVKQLAPLLIGEDALDTGRIWQQLLEAAASIGRQGVAVQALAVFDVALYDCKAKLAGLSLAKLLGSHRARVRCYDTTIGFPSSPIDGVIAAAERSRSRGMGGIKLKVGGEPREDIARVRAVRRALGDDVAIMVDANQAWDRATAKRVGRGLEEFDLTWIEEPVDAHDIASHAALRASLDTPIASGETLSSATELLRLLEGDAVDVIQPDAVRIGGITPYRRVSELADERGVTVAPHFATQLHVHLAATQPKEGWVEWFDWLDPLFEERLDLRDGHVVVPERPGLGITLSSSAREWLVSVAELPEH